MLLLPELNLSNFLSVLHFLLLPIRLLPLFLKMTEMNLQLNHFQLQFLVLNQQLLVLEVALLDGGLCKDVADGLPWRAGLVLLFVGAGELVGNGEGF